MKYEFSKIEEGSTVLLLLHNNNLHMKMEATIDKFIRTDIAIITLQTSVTQIIKFDNIDIELIYTAPDGYPYLWRKSKVVYFKGNYVLQVRGEGVRYNRRCTYRVGVLKAASLTTPDGRIHRVLAKDVSLTGFSITDRKNELMLTKGTEATLQFEDIGHEIDLTGAVIRIEERDSCTIYGFTIHRSCRDLPSYITTKQRRKRSSAPPSYVIAPHNGGKR